MKRIALAMASIMAGTFAATAAQADITTGWVNNAIFGSPIIQEFDLNTGVVLKQITAPLGNNGRGIVQVGNVLYYTSASTNGVYAYDFTTDTNLGTVFTIAGSSGLATMAYDGTNFWIGDYSGTNHVYEYSTTGTLLNTLSLVNCTGFCDGLEYVNGTLISNRSDEGNIYDIYSLTGTLLQSDFITGNPDGSTGIAYDGTFYYTDNVNGSSYNVYDSTGTFIKTTPFVGGTYHLGEDLSVNYAARVDTGGGAVPEPATWAMFLLGFGAIGWTLRGRRQQMAATV
jgi:hypothetical protein